MEIAAWTIIGLAGLVVSYWVWRIAEWYWRGRPYSWDREKEHDDEH